MVPARLENPGVRIVVTAPGEGEVVGDRPGRRVEILADDAAVNATFSRFASGMEGASLHVHHAHTDGFYVLEGELTVRLGLADEQLTVPAGAFAYVPPDVVHGFRNASGAEEAHLNFHVPGSDFANYLRDGRAYDQHEPPADGGRPISLARVCFVDELEAGVDIGGLRVRVEHGASDPRRGSRAYFALADLAVTADEEEAFAPRGSWVQVAGDHAVDGAAYLTVES